MTDENNALVPAGDEGGGAVKEQGQGLDAIMQAIQSLRSNVLALSLGQELSLLAMQPKAGMEQVIAVAQDVDGIKEEDIQAILKELGEGANLKSLAGAIVKKHSKNSTNEKQTSEGVSDDDEVGDVEEPNPIQSMAKYLNKTKKGDK